MRSFVDLGGEEGKLLNSSNLLSQKSFFQCGLRDLIARMIDTTAKGVSNNADTLCQFALVLLELRKHMMQTNKYLKSIRLHMRMLHEQLAFLK